MKGESSGNVQEVLEIRYDCDADTLLLKVNQRGPACHTDARSCFYRTLHAEPEAVADTGSDDIPLS
jgi:phosphoribosyl-AMP cyclohydrolase